MTMSACDEEELSKMEWKENFVFYQEKGRLHFIVHNLYCENLYHISDCEIKCSQKDIQQYMSLMTAQDFSVGVTFNEHHYAYIKKFDYSYTNNLPLFFFVSKDEVCGNDKEKVNLLIKFIDEDLIFIGKCSNSKRLDAIDFVVKHYNYGADE